MLPSPYRFKKHGQSGMELCELLPHLGEVADDITLIRSMYGEHFNHEPSLYLMHSGRTFARARIARFLDCVRAWNGKPKPPRFRRS